MTTAERQGTISRTIGQSGLLSLRTVRGSVRVQGVDGDDATVTARYSSRRPGGSDPGSDGLLRVRGIASELVIDLDEGDIGIRGALARLSGGGPPSIDFDVMLPRGATLRLSGVSADLDISGLAGKQEIRTVSGDARLEGVSGEVSLQSVSGDARIRGERLAVDVTTTSGDVRVSAGILEQVQIRSVSGDVHLAGALAVGIAHAVESVSGDLELAPANGVTLQMSGISGRLRTDEPQESGVGRGRRVASVGDGAARLSFRTMSGDASLLKRKDRDPSASLPRPSEPGEDLSVLQALERGEIDVDEASRRLEVGAGRG